MLLYKGNWQVIKSFEQGGWRSIKQRAISEKCFLKGGEEETVLGKKTRKIRGPIVRKRVNRLLEANGMECSDGT